jgi:DNA helicase II / ATP-dependent DNA helicase PcrA
VASTINLSEYRIIGPPGTGKTTWLARQAQRAVTQFATQEGVAPKDCTRVLISSLTKAAAHELKSRGIELHQDCIGTLHSHAIRALGKPKLCVDKKAITLWNAACKPHHRLTGATIDGMDSSGSASDGDRMLQDYARFQSMLRDRELWAVSLREFADEYESWKRLNGYLDFSDVIHEAYERRTVAPGNPRVIFVDEAQDHDRAELRLVRWWAEDCEKLVIVGDPCQNLYEWRGSEPEAFFEGECVSTKVLSQSYRVPREVHREAVAMIERTDGLVCPEYHPRDFEGSVTLDTRSLKQYDSLAIDALNHTREGKTCMFLASCEYLLKPLAKALRINGVPFWNPYSQGRNTFSPLHPKSGVSVRDRMLCFARALEEFHGEDARVWTADEFAKWVEMVRGEGWLKHGAKKEIEGYAARNKHRVLDEDQIAEWLDPDFGLDGLAGADLGWLVARSNAASEETARYAYGCYRRFGPSALLDDPKVVIGTIHSVKGGEAEVVYLAPDLSREGLDQLEYEPAPVYRLFYVGMTRASEDLHLLAPSGRGSAIKW